MNHKNYWDEYQIANPHNFKFCPKCGKTLEKRSIDNVTRLQCGSCHFIFYQNPIPAVGALIIVENNILLVKRKFEPMANYWSLPSGFIEFGESHKEALVREIKEETNLNIQVGNLYDVFSASDDPRNHIILIFYWVKIIDGSLKPGDDALEARFYPLTQLPQDIAFSCHLHVLHQLQQSGSTEGSG